MIRIKPKPLYNVVSNSEKDFDTSLFAERASKRSVSMAVRAIWHSSFARCSVAGALQSLKHARIVLFFSPSGLTAKLLFSTSGRWHRRISLPMNCAVDRSWADEVNPRVTRQKAQSQDGQRRALCTVYHSGHLDLYVEDIEIFNKKK